MMSSVLKDFDSWKHFLSERIKQAQAMGMSEETISKLAYEIGSFLEEKIDPQNVQQLTLKQLWHVGSDEERKTIARLMVKLAEQDQ